VPDLHNSTESSIFFLVHLPTLTLQHLAKILGIFGNIVGCLSIVLTYGLLAHARRTILVIGNFKMLQN